MLWWNFGFKLSTPVSNTSNSQTKKIEIEELRMAFEGCERSRKQVETELIESNERANMLHVQNTTLVSLH